MCRLFRRTFFFIILVLLIGGLGIPASAKKTKKGWKKAGSYYRYYKDGERLTGKKKIGTKTYYFNEKGYQMTGWQKIGKNYYFFRQEIKSKGYMKKSTKVNGIKLNKKGRAVLSSQRLKRKAALLVSYARWADEIAPVSLKKEDRLRKCYDYLRRSINYGNSQDYRYNDPDQDLYFAELALRQPLHDCYLSAAAFSFLANALGYRNVSLCLNHGHGFVKIGSLIYDPTYGRARDYNGYSYYGREPDAQYITTFRGAV